MTGKIRKFEQELEKEVWRLAEKYGFNDIVVTGTIDPKWYKKHLEGPPTPGLSILFYDYKVE